MIKLMAMVSGLGLLVCIALAFAMQDGVGALTQGYIHGLKMWDFGLDRMRWNWVSPFVQSFLVIVLLLTFFIDRYRGNLLLSKSYTVPMIFLFLMVVGAQIITWLLYLGFIDGEIARKIGRAYAVIMLLAISNYTSTARKSWFSGWPTPWAMKSDLAWAKMHRFLGRGLMILCLCLGVNLFLFDNDQLTLKFWFVAAGFIFIASTVYSYMIWRKDPNREEFRNRKV